MKKLRRKSEVVKRCVEPGVLFFEGMSKEDRIVVIHDDDCDGVCSGSILALLTKKLGRLKGILSTEYNLPLTKRVVREAISFKPDKLVISDVPEVYPDLLKELIDSGIKVLIVDHHKPVDYPVPYCNPRVFDEDAYIPTSCLSYEIHKQFFDDKKILWIACIGILADHGVESCRDIFLRLKDVHPSLVGNAELNEASLFKDSLLGKLVKIVDSAQVVCGKKGAELMSRILVDVKSYEELLTGKGKCKKVLSWYKTAESEFNKILRDFRNNRVFIGRSLVFYELHTRLRMKSRVAGYLSNLYKKRILIIGQRICDHFEFSVRKGEKVKVDLGKFVKEIISGIKGASGGGHPEAAAGRVPYKYLNSFLQRLKVLANCYRINGN